ncbi:Mucin-16 like [Actinidia chinensis var. chinensis]|uniref:Mucin-16 like n=1 Tax=Actinidia chinensis var. chinensis TaxID=1590841 RepID=A0A2R6RAC0_ACTCC|nr:Mucin-16 like [Actinidia chinensis var. chinensis]
MKASIKFREDQNPILRGKVPLNILGFRFQSGFEAGETKNLCLNLSTLFESGPSLKLSYRPNDSLKPFSFGVRTGMGRFGSPIGAPMTMSAEFNLLGNGSPIFCLHFRHRIGDFLIKRSDDSVIHFGREIPSNTRNEDGDSETEDISDDNEAARRRLSVSGEIVERVIAGAEVCAMTAVPVRDRAVVKLRWNLRFQGDGVGDGTADISSYRKIPYLVLSKIGIEQVAANSKGQESKLSNEKADLADEFSALVRRELTFLRAESGLLRKDVEEFRREIGTRS